MLFQEYDKDVACQFPINEVDILILNASRYTICPYLK